MSSLISEIDKLVDDVAAETLKEALLSNKTQLQVLPSGVVKIITEKRP